jgi:catechol-2,3-dioxygenase
MTSRVGDIVIDCADPELLAEFWCGVLGYQVFDRDATGVAVRGSGASPTILFIRVPEPKAVKNRMHFDVCPTDRSQQEELARLTELGATRSRIVGSGSWVVLEDPEGNEFCLMSRRIPPEPAPFHDGPAPSTRPDHAGP